MFSAADDDHRVSVPLGCGTQGWKRAPEMGGEDSLVLGPIMGRPQDGTERLVFIVIPEQLLYMVAELNLSPVFPNLCS